MANIGRPFDLTPESIAHNFKYTTLPFHVGSFQLMSLAVLVSLPSLSEVDSRVARAFLPRCGLEAEVQEGLSQSMSWKFYY